MKRFIESNEKKQYDLVIIGGGVSGSALAYDAAQRSLSVALLEKHDFGWATSAATSKLIHGGLRYLNNLELGLVRESLKERRILENIAPNLVNPFPFLIPHYPGFKTSKIILRTGLTLYDILSFDKKWTWDPEKKVPNHSWLSKKKTVAAEPRVKTEKLKGSSVYYDCQSIQPERFTLSFVKSAVKEGADVANYAEVRGITRDNEGKVNGVEVYDALNEKSLTVNGSLVVNCAGPWVDRVISTASEGAASHQIRRSEGIHIITKKISESHAVVLMTPAGRHFFIIPWRGFSLIGTTDEEYTGDPDTYSVRREAVESLVKDVNDSYGDGSLTMNDVIYAYGGLRPLVDDQTEGTYDSSRKYEIYDNSEDGLDGMLTIEGGKWTTSRNLADTAMKIIGKKLGRTLPACRTDKEFLSGSEIKDIAAFRLSMRQRFSELPDDTVEYIINHYGTEAESILERARQSSALAEQVSHDGEILAEVVHAVENEMARTLEDIVLRRTGIGTAGNPGDSVLQKVADTVASMLGWSEDKKQKEISSVLQKIKVPE